jgi:Peptidase family M48
VNYGGLFCCLALIWYGAAMIAGSTATAPLLVAAARIAEPSLLERRLVFLRSLPTFFAFLVTGLGLVPAFLWLEPRQTAESASAGMMFLAAASAAVILAGPLKGVLSLRMTRRLIRSWERSATPIRIPGTSLPAFAVEEAFPVAAVVGFRRPRLFLARNLLESCSAAEIAAVAAHEVGHLRRGDHWKRLLMRAAPDLVSIAPLGGDIERRWAEAAEQLADEHASRSSPKRALDLASALVKAARLVARSRPRDLPLLALYRGEGVAGRVERLLRPPHELPRPDLLSASARALVLAVAALFLCVSWAFGLDVLHGIHRLAEAVVLLFQ